MKGGIYSIVAFDDSRCQGWGDGRVLLEEHVQMV